MSTSCCATLLPDPPIGQKLLENCQLRHIVTKMNRIFSFHTHFLNAYSTLKVSVLLILEFLPILFFLIINQFTPEMY